MDIFEACHEINDLINDGDNRSARDQLIKLSSNVERENLDYPPYLNELIRTTGLFPYMKHKNATWDQKFVQSAFAVDVGRQKVTLHREQSYVLKTLLDGTDLAVSAPTSFGKSFIIDAYIAAKCPKNVVIIVPTIALMDETRRRIFKKFSDRYEIITAPDADLGENNILIFPQERTFRYLKKLESIDLLVVDEFYKISPKHDKERSPALMKAVLKLSSKAKQRYYLTPNIKKLGQNVFTSGMEFLELLDFNTVFLEKHDLYDEINGDLEKKREHLLRIVGPRTSKTLIYAGNYTELDRVSGILIKSLAPIERTVTLHFANWLRQNYRKDWQLADLVERGVAVHNGQIHRCLSQIQVQIFELTQGFDSIISTSSIIEGVNTSAENIVLWRSKVGGKKLQDFTYKNIIGRGGRMFKHFVGKIYLLDPPPDDQDAQLEIELPDSILGGLSDTWDKIQLSSQQQEKIRIYREEMTKILGDRNHRRLQDEELLNDPDTDFILSLARDMRNNPGNRRGFGHLNSNNPDDWDRILYKIIKLKPGGWDMAYSDVVSVTKIISMNWRDELPNILERLDAVGIGIDKFFKAERAITFKLAALVGDANELYKSIIDRRTDVSRFAARVSHAFLPRAVYGLEEYGLPRMISRKIHSSGMINFEAEECDLKNAIESIRRIGLQNLRSIPSMSPFDRAILGYFHRGITVDSA